MPRVLVVCPHLLLSFIAFPSSLFPSNGPQAERPPTDSHGADPPPPYGFVMGTSGGGGRGGGQMPQPQQPAMNYGYQQVPAQGPSYPAPTMQQPLPMGSVPTGHPPGTVPARAPVVVVQPGAAHGNGFRWLQTSEVPVNGLPLGLDVLRGLDKIVVRQKQEAIEMVTSLEVPNRYYIQTGTGELVFYAMEESDFMGMQMFGNSRAYRFKLADYLGRTVCTVSRPSACCTCTCIPGCEEASTINAGGRQIGSMYRRPAMCASAMTITDGDGTDQLAIDGPLCCERCCSDADFPITAVRTGKHIGKITRIYPGWNHEQYSRADIFEITIPGDLDPRLKASLIGATIMIDFLEFEVNNVQDRHRRNSF